MENITSEENSREKDSREDSKKEENDLHVVLNAVDLIEECLNDKDMYKFKKLINNMYNKFKEDIKNNVHLEYKIERTLLTCYKVASAAAIILGICFFTAIKHYDKPLAKKLACEYNKPYDPYFIRIENASIDLKEAIKLYKEKKYTNAIQHIEKVNDNSNQVVFLKGTLYQENGDYLTALNYLMPLAGNEGSVYYVEIRWNIAMCWLSLNKPEIAKIHLNWLKENDCHYGPKAQEILKRLSDGR